MQKNLDDKKLLETYKEACRLNLDSNFKNLLIEELTRRRIPVPKCKPSTNSGE